MLDRLMSKDDMRRYVLLNHATLNIERLCEHTGWSHTAVRRVLMDFGLFVKKEQMGPKPEVKIDTREREPLRDDERTWERPPAIYSNQSYLDVWRKYGVNLMP